jgi:hypothetical protein
MNATQLRLLLRAAQAIIKYAPIVAASLKILSDVARNRNYQHRPQPLSSESSKSKPDAIRAVRNRKQKSSAKLKTPENHEFLKLNKETILELARRGALAEKRLSMIIDNATFFELSSEEIKELHGIVNRVRTAPVFVCPSCQMVGDSCTCERSWY